MQTPSTWGTELEMLAFTLFFGFRVISFSNQPCRSGVPKFDSLQAITQTNEIIEEDNFFFFVHQYPLMTLYFHTFGSPCTPSTNTLNHFVPLIPRVKPDGVIPYRPCRGGESVASTAQKRKKTTAAKHLNLIREENCKKPRKTQSATKK